MAKKKNASGQHVAPRYFIQLPAEMKDRVAKLARLIEQSLPIKVRLTAIDVVTAAINEAIERREKSNGQSQS